MSPLHNYLIITALGTYRSDLVSSLTRACKECGCSLQNTHIMRLGLDISITLFLAGNWGAIAKLEALIPSLEKRLNIFTITKRTQEITHISNSLSYTIELLAIDKPGILNGMFEFLFRMGIEIEKANSHTFTTHTNTRMFSATLSINIPGTIHLATLREKFMLYCDEENYDGFLEPLKSHAH